MIFKPMVYTNDGCSPLCHISSIWFHIWNDVLAEDMQKGS